MNCFGEMLTAALQNRAKRFQFQAACSGTPVRSRAGGGGQTEERKGQACFGEGGFVIGLFSARRKATHFMHLVVIDGLHFTKG